jgi:hypothetical protein
VIKAFLSYAPATRLRSEQTSASSLASSADGILQPTIDLELPLAEAPDLIQALTERRVRGKAILTISQLA